MIFVKRVHPKLDSETVKEDGAVSAQNRYTYFTVRNVVISKRVFSFMLMEKCHSSSQPERIKNEKRA